MKFGHLKSTDYLLSSLRFLALATNNYRSTSEPYMMDLITSPMITIRVSFLDGFLGAISDNWGFWVGKNV